MKLSDLHPNPKNARKITAKKLEELKQSIQEDPEFMPLQPIIYDKLTKMILGGNQRFQACRALGLEEIPNNWVKSSSLSVEKQRKFGLTDNTQFGEWDRNVLVEEYSPEEMKYLDIQTFEEPRYEETEVELKPFKNCHILVSYAIETHPEIVKLIKKLQELDVEIETSMN